LQAGPSWPDGLVAAFVCCGAHCVCYLSLVSAEGARSAGDERVVLEGVIWGLPGCWIFGVLVMSGSSGAGVV
jgi:hypothetical protein